MSKPLPRLSPRDLVPRILVLGLLAPWAPAQFGPAQLLSGASYQAREVSAADLDGDGDLDVLSCSAGVDKLVWYENLAGGFGPAQAIPNYSDFDAGLALATADLDGDGDLDVIAGARDYEPSLGTSYRVSWHENLGAGFSLPKPLGFDAQEPTSVVAADLDGDGDRDVLWCQNLDGEVHWRESNGDGTFGAFTSLITDQLVRPECVSAEDLDQDGDLDVLTIGSYDGTLAWFENLGGGSFGPQQTISTLADEARSVEAGDLDGDGDADIVYATLSTNSGQWVAWHENLGGGSFGAVQYLSGVADQKSWDAHLVDLNRDGRLDVLVGEVLEVVWYRNSGGGDFAGSQSVTSEVLSVHGVHAADLNGDGEADVLTASANNSEVAWFEQQPVAAGTAYCFGDGSGASCPCFGFGGPGEGCATTSGQGAVLSGQGVPNVVDDEVVMHVTGGPPLKPGLLFQGASVLATPLGDGILCTSSQLRHEVHLLGPDGSTSYADLGQDAAAGQTLRYQYWFRDPQNACGGGFNFTNGYALTW